MKFNQTTRILHGNTGGLKKHTIISKHGGMYIYIYLSLSLISLNLSLSSAINMKYWLLNPQNYWLDGPWTSLLRSFVAYSTTHEIYLEIMLYKPVREEKIM
jgi:hypothetical protein